MRELVYLVGQISPKFPITYKWRQTVINYFKNTNIRSEREVNMEQMKFINPCANMFNQSVLEKREYAVKKSGRVPGIDLLPSKDYTYVRRSSIGLVNMNQYDPKKVLLGSFYELAWYFSFPEKAVVAFAKDLNSYLCQHPFVQQTVNYWCNDEHEACEILEKYFLDV